jgi:hypothetical protein
MSKVWLCLCRQFRSICLGGFMRVDYNAKFAGAVGGASGIGGSVGAVSVAGSVAGLSAAGVTSGLAAIGSLVGGGMVAGLVITAGAPLAIGAGSYSLVKWFNS